MMKYVSLSVLYLFLGASCAQAYVSAGTSYRLQFDSINFGGGLSSSAVYNQESTFGELSSGELTGTTYNLKAGYQQMTASSISISSPSDIALGSISGSSETSSGSAVWTVITDSTGGYTLAVKASTNPALQASGGNFTDYTPATSAPDYAWSVSASTAAFGYTVDGTDTATRFLDNGASCNASGGGATASTCWDGLSTSNVTIASATSGNSPSGIATTVTVKAETGSSANQAAGAYTATLTVTALA
ncbi:MAG: hypothetical protein NUV65_00995, partial [Candidatus Roizmanbacteria bacterium]|nr:hypothetical protein [Candidatus Roizmanbacteria bacterium]